MGTLRPGQAISVIAGSLVLLLSFTDQVKHGDNLWSDFGLQTFPPLLAGLIVALIAIDALGEGAFPTQVGPLRTSQWLVAFALTAALVSIGTWQMFEHAGDLAAMQDPDVDVELTASFWLGLLSSLALLGGAVLDHRTAATPSAATSPF